MAGDLDIAAIYGVIAQLAKFAGETGVADGDGSHIDAPLLLAEIHGNADYADGLGHDLLVPQMVPEIDDEILDIGKNRLGLG